MATPWEWEYIGEAAPWKGKSVKNRHGVHWQIDTRHAIITYRETLLPLRGASLILQLYPGRCPGLCAHWAFSPQAVSILVHHSHGKLCAHWAFSPQAVGILVHHSHGKLCAHWAFSLQTVMVGLAPKFG